MPHPRLKPKALKNNARIGVVAPARHAPREWLDQGKAALEREGFEVFIHPQCYAKEFQLAGSDKERAQAINNLFADKTIDAILCPRGGIGSYRVVPHLDFELIKNNPKIFCGFSDLTTLLQTIHKRTGLITFHGPMLLNFFGDHDDYNLQFLARLFRNEVVQPLAYPTTHVLRHGIGEGALVGGNITLLQHLMGSADDFETDGKILFIEDVDEKLSDIDRALWHLQISGRLKNISGLIVGEFTSLLDDKYGPWGHGVEAMINDIILPHLPAHVPVLSNFPCGHGRIMTTLPIGLPVKLEATENGAFLHYRESPFA